MINNTRKMEKSVNIRICFTQNVQDIEFSDNFIIITPYIRMLDSDWLIAVIFFYKFRPCIVNLYLFNYTEYYLKHWLNKYYLLFVVFTT
jgi:hypothetical protein